MISKSRITSVVIGFIIFLFYMTGCEAGWTKPSKEFSFWELIKIISLICIVWSLWDIVGQLKEALNLLRLIHRELSERPSHSNY